MAWLVEHYSVLTQSLGGLGLFLIGMIVMTDGLRALAGDSIRTALFRFTRSPLSGAVTGAASTAILQSSSATTVAAIGFVAAGLMTFSEALGIIFGANIGTTITGWLVALLGFKFKITQVLLPLIFVGAIIRLFSKGRLAAFGLAIAGFGLIFSGIFTLQAGMTGLQGILSFDSFPGDSTSGRLYLVLFGIIYTVITQSSSAGVAAALTALFSGLITFEQAAALVIGMDVGTTVKAAIVTIGASVGARRTGYSHVVYNLFTASGAFFLITPYTFLWNNFLPGQLQANPEIALVAFHTMFNTLGVIIVLPFTHKFARLMVFLVRGKEDLFIEKLDKSLLDEPKMAMAALNSIIHDEFFALLSHVRWLISNGNEGQFSDLAQLHRALDETQLYVDQIQLKDGNKVDREQLIAMIHTLDHLQRLHERCEEEESRVMTARQTHLLKEVCELMNRTINDSIHSIEHAAFDEAIDTAQQLEEHILENDRPYRASIMEAIAVSEIDVHEGTHRLEAIRWLERVSHHLSRLMQYQKTLHPEASK